MRVMEEKNRWGSLLEDSFFDHISGRLCHEDVQRLLNVIGNEFYLKNVSFGSGDSKWEIQASPIRKETIGYKAQELKSTLAEWLCQSTKGELMPPSVDDAGWAGLFYMEPKFQAYVFQLLDTLISRTQSTLPGKEQVLSYQERARAAAWDTATEFEDEVGKAEAARISAEAAKEAADSAKATADSIMPNMLTTLGVFVAIIIAVVACYLSLVLSDPYVQTCPGEVPKTLNIVMLLLMGHILLNIIFLLLYLISKMSAHPLSCHCLVGDQSDCQKCKPDLRARCRFRHKLWLRYPYVVAMNGAFVTAYCALGLWHLVRRYFGASIDAALAGGWHYAALVVGTAAVLMAAAAIFVFHFFLRSPRHKLEADQKREQKKRESTQKKVRKIEHERRSIRKLEKEFNQQQKRIMDLEEAVNQMQAQLTRYQQERDNTPIP